MESLRQSKDRLQCWLSYQNGVVNTTAKDTRALSLKILAYVGFGKSYPFDGNFSISETSYAASFRDSLSIVLDNALLTLAIPPRVLKLPVTFGDWSRVGQAVGVLKDHMATSLRDERCRYSHGKKGAGTLMSSMVDALETASYAPSPNSEKNDQNVPQRSKGRLTVNEIFGNIFVYYFAGYDTTAAVFMQPCCSQRTKAVKTGFPKSCDSVYLRKTTRLGFLKQPSQN